MDIVAGGAAWVAAAYGRPRRAPLEDLARVTGAPHTGVPAREDAMMRMLLVPTFLVLASVASSTQVQAALRSDATTVKCCLETSVDDQPPHPFCFNLYVVRARPRRARLRARIACRLIGGRPLHRRAA